MKHQDIMRAHRKSKKILTWYCSGSAPHGALYAIVCQYNSEVTLEGQGNGFWYFLGPAPVWRQSLRITAIVSNIDATRNHSNTTTSSHHLTHTRGAYLGVPDTISHSFLWWSSEGFDNTWKEFPLISFSMGGNNCYQRDFPSPRRLVTPPPNIWWKTTWNHKKVVLSILAPCDTS